MVPEVVHLGDVGVRDRITHGERVERELRCEVAEVVERARVDLDVQMPFKAVFNFRPAYIQPLRGVTSRTKLYAVMYGLVGWLYPVLRRVFPRYVTNSVTVGRAMIHVARDGHAQSILENWDINEVAGGADGERP